MHLCRSLFLVQDGDTCTRSIRKPAAGPPAQKYAFVTVDRELQRGFSYHRVIIIFRSVLVSEVEGLDAMCRTAVIPQYLRAATA